MELVRSVCIGVCKLLVSLDGPNKLERSDSDKLSRASPAISASMVVCMSKQDMCLVLRRFDRPLPKHMRDEGGYGASRFDGVLGASSPSGIDVLLPSKRGHVGTRDEGTWP